MKEKIFIIVALVVASFFLAGCESKNPYFVKDTIKIEPTYLRPNINNDRVVLHYEIKNPTELDFNGNVSYKYDTDCLRIYTTETEVVTPAKEDDGYSVDIVLSSERNYPENCYGTQSILLILSNSEGTILYDSESVDLSVTK